IPTWLRNLAAGTVPSRARRSRLTTARRQPSRCRPRLESLEDRVVPDAGDTLQRALNTHLGPSAGTYTMLSEHLGHGSLGSLHVDLYKLKANAGEALTAATSPAVGGASMDTILRLFDAAGNELASNDDFNTLYSQIDDYLFSASGTYYIGVSGFPNFSYDPNTRGSRSSGSIRDY